MEKDIKEFIEAIEKKAKSIGAEVKVLEKPTALIEDLHKHLEEIVNKLDSLENKMQVIENFMKETKEAMNNLFKLFMQYAEKRIKERKSKEISK